MQVHSGPWTSRAAYKLQRRFFLPICVMRREPPCLALRAGTNLFFVR